MASTSETGHAKNIANLKSLNEIKDILSKFGLKFGMEIPGWPPENVEELAKKHEDPY